MSAEWERDLKNVIGKLMYPANYYPCCTANIMKGTKVQTLGTSAVAGAWTVHGWLIGHAGNNYYGHGCNY